MSAQSFFRISQSAISVDWDHVARVLREESPANHRDAIRPTSPPLRTINSSTSRSNNSAASFSSRLSSRPDVIFKSSLLLFHRANRDGVRLSHHPKGWHATGAKRREHGAHPGPLLRGAYPREASIHSGPLARKPSWADSIASISSGCAKSSGSEEAQKIFQAPVEQAGGFIPWRERLDRDLHILLSRRVQNNAGSLRQYHARQSWDRSTSIGSCCTSDRRAPRRIFPLNGARRLLISSFDSSPRMGCQ